MAKLSRQGYDELGRMHLIQPDNTMAGRPVVWSHLPSLIEAFMSAMTKKSFVCLWLRIRSAELARV